MACAKPSRVRPMILIGNEQGNSSALTCATTGAGTGMFMATLQPGDVSGDDACQYAVARPAMQPSASSGSAFRLARRLRLGLLAPARFVRDCASTSRARAPTPPSVLARLAPRPARSRVHVFAGKGMRQTAV